MNLETVNAKIKSTMLGVEDHGILTFYLHCEWPGSGCGFGGYAIDKFDPASGKRLGYGPGLTAIKRVIETVGVESWEKLAGQVIRVSHDGNKILAIGNLLEDRWFDPAAFFAENK